MSTGLVICSVCHKEVHQDGPRDKATGNGTWRHCSRFHSWTPICDKGKAIYPDTREQIRGLFCQADGLAPASIREEL